MKVPEEWYKDLNELKEDMEQAKIYAAYTGNPKFLEDAEVFRKLYGEMLELIMETEKKSATIEEICHNFAENYRNMPSEERNKNLAEAGRWVKEEYIYKPQNP